ncbi:MAG: histone deacetylase family protein, partial [Candidatus Sericytochromatia bacterium]|nr:histone deacetylase family protein [Candidatus Sericytochromatia bacterium]
MNLTALVSHPDMFLHEMGPHHPEAPGRLAAIEERLRVSGLMDFLRCYEAPLASDEQLCRIHDPAYVARIRAAAPNRGYVQLDPDTSMNRHSLAAALRAAGAVIRATDLVLSGEVRTAFCNVRPPGHHAERNRAMGFCLFNNVAIGVAHALSAHGLERVALVDFDVHHGNGSEDALQADPRVLFVSTFQHPFYPGTHFATANPHVVDLPLPAGTDGTLYRERFAQVCVPALERFRPQLVFCSAGFDGHRDDDMAGWNLADADYAWISAQIMSVASRHAGGRVVSVLEGGYQLAALGRSAAAH